MRLVHDVSLSKFSCSAGLMGLVLLGIIGFLVGTLFRPDQSLYWATGVSLVLWSIVTAARVLRHQQTPLLLRRFSWTECVVLVATSVGYLVPMEEKREDRWSCYLRPLSLVP